MFIPLPRKKCIMQEGRADKNRCQGRDCGPAQCGQELAAECAGRQGCRNCVFDPWHHARHCGGVCGPPWTEGRSPIIACAMPGAAAEQHCLLRYRHYTSTLAARLPWCSSAGQAYAHLQSQIIQGCMGITACQEEAHAACRAPIHEGIRS